MKLRLITLTAACAAMLATISIANAQDPASQGPGGNGPRHHRNWGNALEHMTKTLDLTADQQAKIRPILEQAKPQMKAAREESRQKMKAIRDNVRSQIRPLLTPAQQRNSMPSRRRARTWKRPARQCATRPASNKTVRLTKGRRQRLTRSQSHSQKGGGDSIIVAAASVCRAFAVANAA